MKKYPAVEFDKAGLNKHINADVAVKIGQFVVKFHQQPLYTVIEFE